MKKSFCVFMVAVLVFSALFSAKIPVHGDVEGLYNYTVSEAHAFIKYYLGSEQNVVIPEQLGGYPVTAIMFEAFYYNRANLVSVTLPDTMSSIQYRAFQGCTKLVAINAGSGNQFFYSEGGVLFRKNAAALYQYPVGKSGPYTVPEGITKIDDYAFEARIGLTAITLPQSVKTIGDYAFNSCVGLTEFPVLSGVTTIGRQAFSDCTGFDIVNISPSVISIGDYAFDRTGISAINVDGANANFSSENGVLFNKNKQLLLRFPEGKTGAYSIPDTVKTIGSYSFSECSQLTEVTIPNTVELIDSGAFEKCSGILDISIPDSVITIEDSAFGQCSRLRTVKLGRNVNNIGYCAFLNCNDLYAAYFLGNAPAIVADDNMPSRGATIFKYSDDSFKIYYLTTALGFTNPWFSFTTVEVETLPPSPTATPTSTATPSPTVAPTATPTASTSPALTPTATPTFTATPTPTLTPNIAVSAVSLSKTSLKLNVGKTYRLYKTIQPINATNKNVTWKSSNTKCATVSSTGLVTAKARGYATITVKTLSGGKVATCKITVIQPVRSVYLNRKTITIKKGSTYRLIANVYPSNANNKKVTWKSGNKSIVTVGSTGIVKGIKKGATYIYVYTVDGKKTARCRVIVK